MRLSHIASKVLVPFAITTGLSFGIGYAATTDSLLIAPFAPQQAMASTTTGSTVLSTGSFSVVIPKGYEAVKSNEILTDSVFGAWYRTDETDPTCNGGQIVRLFMCANAPYVANAELAKTYLTSTPYLTGATAESDKCQLETKIYEAETDSGGYLYYALVTYDNGETGGFSILATDDDGNPFLMFIIGVTESDRATDDYFAQVETIARSITGGVRIIGLTNTQLPLSTLHSSRIDSEASSFANSNQARSDSSSSTPSHGTTTGERNALNRAQDYLEFMAFSRSGLIDQLEYEGFTSSEAEYAVDHCGANWNEQAKLKAQEYLRFMSFSRSGLIDQLVYEGFTNSQASAAASAVGL